MPVAKGRGAYLLRVEPLATQNRSSGFPHPFPESL